jgi:MYXO-CTERM domain-containing protein
VVFVSTAIDAAQGELCTGVLVGPRTVLTAGHCTLNRAPSDLFVGFGPLAKFPTGTASIVAIATYPAFQADGSDRSAGMDLGIVELAADAPVAPLALADVPPASAGPLLRLVGYGDTSEMNPESQGQREAADVVYAPRCDRLIQVGDADARACHGDSGGPLLATQPDGSLAVVALVSSGSDPSGSCAPPGLAVRIAPYSAWIQSFVVGSGDGACSTTCPPASVDCSSAADAAIADVASLPTNDAGSTEAGPTSNGCAASPGRASGVTPLVIVGIAAALARRRRRELVIGAIEPRGCTLGPWCVAALRSSRARSPSSP